jgi:hypothetical protein
MSSSSEYNLPPCRCGYKGEGPHPCHARAYTCGKPATPRFYVLGPAALAGMQIKFSALETWACDECWRQYLQLVAEDSGTG